MLVQVPFNNLPEESRERLAQVLLARSKDASAIRDTGRGLYWLGWLVVFLGTVGLLWRVNEGLGIPWHEQAIQGTVATVEYLIFGGMIGLPLPWLLVRFIRRRACPFPPGRYLLPTDYIDARDPILQLVPVRQARSIQLARSASIAQIALEFNGPSGRVLRETFVVRGKDRVTLAVDAFLDAQSEHDRAIEAGDVESLREMDPFYEVRSAGWSSLHSGNLEPTSSTRVRPIPWWTRGIMVWFPVAALVGTMLLVSVRNDVSDQMVFEALLNEDTTDGWQWYLDQGGQYASEVRSVHLRRAEDAEQERRFVACQTVPTVACWDAWLRDYQNIDRYREWSMQVTKELKPETALNEALAKGSVGALRDLRERVGVSVEGGIGMEVDREIAASIAEARDQLLAQLTEDELLISTMSGLLAWLEVRALNEVMVRFEAPEESEVAEIDAKISNTYGEAVALSDGQGDQLGQVPIAQLAPHFQFERELHREQILVDMLGRGFGAVVPQDILRLRLGEPLAPAEVLGTVSVPTVVIRTNVEVVRDKMRRIQVLLPPEAYLDDPRFDELFGMPSIRLSLELSIHLPGIEEHYSQDFDVIPSIEESRVATSLVPHGAEQSVLDAGALVNGAYWMLAGQLRSALFRPGTRAHVETKLPEDEVVLRALVVTMIADGMIQDTGEEASHASEKRQVGPMLEKWTGIVITDEILEEEIKWVEQSMGNEGWIDRVARGKELINQPMQSLPKHVRRAIPLVVGWMGQVHQDPNDRNQGGLSDSEHLLLSRLMNDIGMTQADYTREWRRRFRK